MECNDKKKSAMIWNFSSQSFNWEVLYLSAEVDLRYDTNLMYTDR